MSSTLRSHPTVPTPLDEIDPSRPTEAYQGPAPVAEASKPSSSPLSEGSIVKPGHPEDHGIPPPEPHSAPAPFSSLSSRVLEDPGGPRGVDHPALGGESAGPFHHHRFYSVLLNGKLVSMPCDVPVDDGRGGLVPCGLTWEENVEIAVTRYDRAARREGRT